MVEMIGAKSIRRETRTEGVDIFITFIWSCTNFLVPKTNG